MSLKAGIKKRTTQNEECHDYKVIVAANVSTAGPGEYFIKAMVVDERNCRETRGTTEYIFTSDKQRLAERQILAADSMITSTDEWTLVKIYIIEENQKRFMQERFSDM